MFIRSSQLVTLWIFDFVLIDVISVNTLANNGRLARNFNTHSFFFQTLDLVKVFGRLSEPSLIGSVIPSSKDRLGNNFNVKNLKWRSLFKNKSEELNLEEFTKRLYKCNFSWPLDYITNRTVPFLIPLKFRNKFKIKCKCFPVSMGTLNEIKKKLSEQMCMNGEVSMNTINSYINKEKIEEDSIESTFKALSGEEDKLTVEHMMAYINYRSPLVEMINWNCFISSLPVGPEDAWT